ncbi:MAG: protein-tyrosine-phosphatase [Bacteroidota bacterium]
MNHLVKKYCDQLILDFYKMLPERKIILNTLSSYISAKINEHKKVNLIYICTHNSRRSQFGQIWAKVAAHYYKIDHVNTFSGGTEATVFNINAINALKRIGFDVKPINNEKNATFHVYYDDVENPIVCFSKLYDDPKNPYHEFAAVMTCSDAEENCPFIPNVELRIGTTYQDPKEFDNTALQDVKYDERCKQIATETFYVFSNI